MIFSIFASKRTKWKKRLTKAFDVYIPGLQGMDDEELGMLLDQAVQIKDASLITLDKNDRERLFWEDPALLDEKESLDRLDFWHKWMLEWAKEGVMGNSKNASFQIYFNSLGGCAIIELKVRAKEMWKELSRGFSSCGRFDPNVDIPIGLKNFKK